MKLLIVTNAPTFKERNKFSAYAPYVKEMDIWFKNAQEVGILSPGSYPESVFTKPFNWQKINFYKVPFLRLSSFLDFVKIVFVWPVILFQFLRSFLWADHIHIRCPGNLGLIGCLIQIFFPAKPKTAKYAGNWNPAAEQPWSYKLQKRILNNTFLTRNMKVLVYGKWPNQSKNITPFFTASFSETEKEKVIRKWDSPIRFLFVGSLVEGKQPIVAMRIVQALHEKNVPVEVNIYGDGNLKGELKEFSVGKNYIHLQGNKAFEVVQQAYKDSHFLVLPSRSEGWPKAVAEAMFFGCIPIATNVSCVPWMLGAKPTGEGRAKISTLAKRGILTSQPQNGVKGKAWVEKVANEVGELIKNPQEMRRISLEAQEWSQQYTLEKFEEAIKEVFSPLPIAIGTKKREQKKKL